MSSQSPASHDVEATDSDDRAVANAKGALDVVQTASKTVDRQLEAIDDRASEQATDAQWVVEEISTLSATIEEVAATASQVSTQSERATAEARDGREAAQRAIDTMADVRAVSEAVAQQVDALAERIDRIETALDGIDRITDQTNMLALNASIEAARAGSESDGFAVVADEIKQLAEESQEQADDIDEALDAVRTATEDTVEQLDDAVDEIDNGTEQVSTAMESFDSVVDTVSETADGIASVSDATDEQASSSEAVATRCETLAERATAIDDDLSSIRSARSEQTAMLSEIDDALSTADANRRSSLANAQTIETGVPGVDDMVDGGLIVGGQSVLSYDEGTPVDGVLAQVCATAIASGTAVSLSLTPTLDRETLATAFDAAELSLDQVLADDRLFVLDMFDTWPSERNVFDLSRCSLSEANERTVTRRTDPLLIVGNIEGEVATIGEEAARSARYENDDGVFEDTDTVLNVISQSVPETLAAFYTGSADQELALVSAGDRQYAEFRTANAGTSDGRQPITVLSEPPFVRVGGH